MSYRDDFDLDELMEKCAVPDRVRGYIRDCVAFHTFPAAGLLIGAFMVDLAVEKLGVQPGERLYAVSETPKCAPDAIQVILHATLGNHGLRIIDTGRYAITVNRFSKGTTADGIRVYIDVEKAKKYPVLYQWYTNDPNYKGGVSNRQLIEEILTTGNSILAWEPVRVRFTPKAKWNSKKCARCGEMVPENTLENGICQGCGTKSYYDQA